MSDNKVSNLALLIGQTADLSIEELYVRVRILDAKTAYGRVRVQVSPTHGGGAQWVETTRITNLAG